MYLLKLNYLKLISKNFFFIMLSKDRFFKIFTIFLLEPGSPYGFLQLTNFFCLYNKSAFTKAFNIEFFFGLQSIVLTDFILPFCRSPTFIDGILKVGTS